MCIPDKQYFSFPPDAITHLWKNPFSAPGLLKLYKTCKYFYCKRQILILAEKKESCLENNQSYSSISSKTKNSNVPFWFSGYLLLPLEWHSKKLYRCTANVLHIHYNNLSFDEFEMLISENTVKEFILFYGSVGNSDGSLVAVDVILRNLPNVTRFEYKVTDEDYSMETLIKMNSVKFNFKLKVLKLLLHVVGDTFDPSLLCKFVKQNMSRISVIEFAVGGNTFITVTAALNNSVNKMLQNWIGKKPKIIVI